MQLAREGTPRGATSRRARRSFDALERLARAGAPRRTPPHGLPPWRIVHQQSRRRLAAGVIGSMVRDPRLLSRGQAGRRRRPTAAILDSCTPQSTPGSGGRAGWEDGAERRKGSEPHTAVDTLGHPSAAHVTPADERDRARVGRLAAAVREATGEGVELAYADQACTGDAPAADTAAHGIRLGVVTLPGAEGGFVLPPGRRVAGRPFARAARRRRSARDDERPPEALRGSHLLALVCLTARKAAPPLASGHQLPLARERRRTPARGGPAERDRRPRAPPARARPRRRPARPTGSAARRRPSHHASGPSEAPSPTPAPSPAGDATGALPVARAPAAPSVALRCGREAGGPPNRPAPPGHRADLRVAVALAPARPRSRAPASPPRRRWR
jgi:transposase